MKSDILSNMNANNASQSTEHHKFKDSTLQKNDMKKNCTKGNCDHGGSSSTAQGMRGTAEELRLPLMPRARSTAWRTLSRFFSWKLFTLPAPNAIAIPNFGEAGQSISIRDVNTDVVNQLKPAKTIAELLHKTYSFWYNQPVPRMDEKSVTNEFMEPPAWALDLGEKPIPLPDGFDWDTLNLDNPLVLKELYIFLRENYIEDDKCMFRFDYQMDFLKWALQPPAWKMDFHCGVRAMQSRKLVAFLSGTPAQLRIYDKVKTVVEMNFLCVHKELRAKRIAACIMMEMARRVKLAGIFLGTYTSGIVLPTPIASCRYWLRPINPQKLIETKFSITPINMTMQKTFKKFKLPDLPMIPGFRKLEHQDFAKVMPLLNHYLSKFHLSPIFNEQEFAYWFTPLADVIDSFVVEAADGSITDFASYFTLSFTVLDHPVHKTLKVAYLFYNVSTKTPWVDLMQDVLVTAKNSGFDIFYALDVMENKQFFKPLKFHKSNGNLHYYLYNWRCPSMTPDKVGLVLH